MLLYQRKQKNRRVPMSADNADLTNDQRLVHGESMQEARRARKGKAGI